MTPWFVAIVNGKPDFRIADKDKLRRALEEKLCWICGEHLDVGVFVTMPSCAVLRLVPEPPSHRECALEAIKTCPYLLGRERRSDGSLNMHDMKNPGASMLWTTKHWKAERGLIWIGEPLKVEWFCQGREATRREVKDAIESRIAFLETFATPELVGRGLQTVESMLPA